MTVINDSQNADSSSLSELPLLLHLESYSSIRHLLKLATVQGYIHCKSQILMKHETEKQNLKEKIIKMQNSHNAILF